jgi:hypothetical protein
LFSACIRLNPRTCIALSTADSPAVAPVLVQLWSVSGYDVVVSACTRLNHAHAFALSTAADSPAAQCAQPWCSLEREWLTRSLFQYAHAPIPTHTVLSTVQTGLQLSAAQSVLPERAVHDARCFSMHRLNPRTCISFCPLQIHRSSAHQSGAAWREWLRRLLFPACTPQSTHYAFVLSTADSPAAPAQYSPGSLSVSGHDARLCFSTRLNPRTCIALSTVQIHTAAQCSTVLVQPGG